MVRSAVDGQISGSGRVLIAERPGIHAHLFGRHVNESFSGRIDLRCPESPVRGTERMVCGATPGKTLEVGNIIAVEADRHKIVEDFASHAAICSMVKTDIILGGNDFTVLITGNPSVCIGCRSLTGHMVELFIAQCHGAGHIQILYGGGDKSIGVGAHGIAKGPAHRVHYYSEIIHGNAAGH